MPRVHDIQPSFSAGELSPRLAARLDFIKYPFGLETCENLITLAEGGVTRRSGTRYVSELKDSSVKGRLKRFQFSTTQAYILEMGEQAMRFYRHQGQITIADTDASVTNGSLSSDIDLAFSQIWQVDDTPSGNAYVDETTDANSASNADWTVFPATEANDDYVAFGYTAPFGQLVIDYANGTAGIAGAVTWEYWNGSAWTSLSNVTDGTAGFTLAAADGFLVNWDTPSDWAATIINGSASLYFIRAKITIIYSTNPVLDQGWVRVWEDRSTGGSGNQISYDSVNDRLTLETSGSNGTEAYTNVAFSQVWQVDDTPSGTAYVDETADANSATNSDWTVFPATEANDDYMAIGYTETFGEIIIDYANGTAGVGGSVDWEYWNGSSWTALSGVTDGTTGFTASVADGLSVSWTIPSDWVTASINSSDSLFYIRAKITSTYSTNPVLDQGWLRVLDKKDIGWASQGIATTDINQEHVLRFPVVGDPGDKIEFQVGTTPTGSDTLSAVEKYAGYHCVAFTPTTSPFYIQFRNLGVNADKDIQIGALSFIDNSPLEITTPWPESVLFDVEGPQSADVLYLFHDSYPTHKLERYGHTSWSLVEVAWQDGPYLDMNETTTTLTPSATTGTAITMTASSITGINDNEGFKSTDVGRLIRLDNPSSNIDWGWGLIVGYTSSTIVTVHVKEDFARTNADVRWHLGAWSETTGYPQVATFFEQRLYVGATTEQPQTFWASQTADFEYFRSDDGAGTVEDDDSLNFTLSADDVNAIRWMSAGENRLVIGTVGGEWLPSSSGIVITPLDITCRRYTTHGSGRVNPVRIGGTVLYVQSALRKIREFAFVSEVEGYREADITRLAEHITRGGVDEIAYAEEKNSVLHAIRSDGQLLSLTYKREEDVVGWSRQIIGGSFGTGDAVVESVEVIPGADGAGQYHDSTNRDEVWIIVKRTINGSTVRYVEFFERDFETGDDQEDAYYSDSLITYNGAAATTITGLDHLEGETVKVLADGAVVADKTVSSGQITLDIAATPVQIGLGYTHKGKTLKVKAGNPVGTPLGKKKRVYGVTFILLNSHTLKYGPNSSNLIEIDFREVGDAMDSAAPLFTGEKTIEFEGDWKNDPRIYFEDDNPAPFTLLAIAPEISVNPLK